MNGHCHACGFDAASCICSDRDCDCGEPSTKQWDEGADFAFWTRRPRFTPVCDECFTKRDNYEPPDPDGEAFRGNEASAYQAEKMEAARRLK